MAKLILVLSTTLVVQSTAAVIPKDKSAAKNAIPFWDPINQHSAADIKLTKESGEKPVLIPLGNNIKDMCKLNLISKYESVPLNYKKQPIKVNLKGQIKVEGDEELHTFKVTLEYGKKKSIQICSEFCELHLKNSMSPKRYIHLNVTADNTEEILLTIDAAEGNEACEHEKPVASSNLWIILLGAIGGVFCVVAILALIALRTGHLEAWSRNIYREYRVRFKNVPQDADEDKLRDVVMIQVQEGQIGVRQQFSSPPSPILANHNEANSLNLQFIHPSLDSSKANNPNPEPTNPNPEPTNPNPEPTNPNPEPTNPNPEPIDPNPKPTDPNPEPTNPNLEPIKIVVSNEENIDLENFSVRSNQKIFPEICTGAEGKEYVDLYASAS